MASAAPLDYRAADGFLDEVFHVKIGHGRRYADVPPIKGVYRGGANAELDASVTMTRSDPQASARA